MKRAALKRDDGVKRRALVRQLQIELDNVFRNLTSTREDPVDDRAVENCSGDLRSLQSKHSFMAYPERMDIIQERRHTLIQRKHNSAELRQRISEQEAAIVARQNFTLAEVTDNTRAAKLAEKMFDLYTMDWADLYEATRAKLPAKHPDEVITGGIRDIMELCYVVCRDRCNSQFLRMNDILHSDVKGVTITPPLGLRIKESQMNMAPFSLTHLQKIIKTELTQNFDKLLKQLKLTPFKTPLVEFLERCIELIWFSQIREPPIKLEFSLLGDMTLYEPFTQRGLTVDHVVWPVLFLHEHGPVLAKGVAKFNED